MMDPYLFPTNNVVKVRATNIWFKLDVVSSEMAPTKLKLKDKSDVAFLNSNPEQLLIMIFLSRYRFEC